MQGRRGLVSYLGEWQWWSQLPAFGASLPPATVVQQRSNGATNRGNIFNQQQTLLHPVTSPLHPFAHDKYCYWKRTYSTLTKYLSSWIRVVVYFLGGFVGSSVEGVQRGFCQQIQPPQPQPDTHIHDEGHDTVLLLFLSSASRFFCRLALATMATRYGRSGCETR